MDLNPQPQPLPQAHLGHSPVQDDAALLGEGLLGAQQVVDEQGDAGKTISFQSVQVLQGRGDLGSTASIPGGGGTEPWERRGRKSSGEKGPAWGERQRPEGARQACSPILWGDAC